MWTTENVETLKALWAEGLSASQIAGRIGAVTRNVVTRNAVIGKVHRLGLSSRVATTRARVVRRPVAKKTAGVTILMAAEKSSSASAALSATGSVDARMRANLAKEPPTLPAPFEEPVIPIAERKTVQTLEECHCRWPIGDPQESEFHFCGKSKVAGLPYCELHARRAYQPPQARRPFEPWRLPAQSLLSRRLEIA